MRFSRLFLGLGVAAISVSCFISSHAQPPDAPRIDRGPDRGGESKPEDGERRPEGGERGGERPGAPPPNPFMLLFDTDKNGEISSSEIESAVTALKTLDKDGDGVITHEEIPRPPRPRGEVGREGGRPGDRGPGDRGPGEPSRPRPSADSRPRPE